MRKAIIILTVIFVAFLLLMFGKRVYNQTRNNIKEQKIMESNEKNRKDTLPENIEEVVQKKIPHELIIVGLKKERTLQLYSKIGEEIKYIKEYYFTASSGELGPKLQKGDEQIPEGIYKIEYLNPNSSYHLSLKINYPNEFDIAKSKFKNIGRMGGDIFIHGKAVTLGCIPIGDSPIEDVYEMAEKAFDNGIKVIISPWDFRKIKEYPEIEAIDWEKELYDMISAELKKLPEG